MPWKPIPPVSRRERSEFVTGNRKKARFLVDESLGQDVAKRLRERGWNVIHVSEVGLAGHPDENVLAHAYREDRILLTHDPGLLGNRTLLPSKNPGVIVLPGAEGNRGALDQALENVLLIVATSRELWRATKIAISEDGTWSVATFERGEGRLVRSRYRVRRGGVPEYWEDETA